MALTFTAIEFETANQHRYSACAVGLAKVVDGVVVDSTSMLIQPPKSVEFHPMNTRIHGLTRLDVARAPGWDELWPWLMNMVGDDVLVAHNASFDRSVMRNACEKYGIAWHDPTFACTYRTAQSVLRLGSYSLPWVARELVHTFGATSQPGVNKKTSILVVGDFDRTTLRPGPKSVPNCRKLSTS